MAHCPHHFLQIEEFTILGQVVGCTQCNKTFHQPEDISAKYYLPFVHTIPGKGDRDVCFLIHHSRVKIENAITT